MDIGLSHVVTVDGKIIPAYWDAFNPNLAAGVNQEILLFENTLRKQVKHGKIKQTMRRERW